MEQIPDRIDSTFRYILIAAKRAEQLVRGAKPRLEMPNRKPTRVAMREVVENLGDGEYGPAPDPAPGYGILSATHHSARGFPAGMEVEREEDADAPGRGACRRKRPSSRHDSRRTGNF